MTGYQELVKDILHHDVFLKTRTFPHHRGISVYEHAVHVSYTAFLVGKKLKMPLKALTRGALLHDFYLYDWHKRRPNDSRRFQLHGFRHPKVALENAQMYFEVSALEATIIYKHMWPLTPFRIPYRKEELLVTLVDKYCSLLEILSPPKCLQIKAFTDTLITWHRLGP